jgi:hypothetical protein
MFMMYPEKEVITYDDSQFCNLAYTRDVTYGLHAARSLVCQLFRAASHDFLSVLNCYDSQTVKKLWDVPGTVCHSKAKKKTKLRGFSPQAKYTNRATAACRRS